LEIFENDFGLPIITWELLQGPKYPKLHYIYLEKTQRTYMVFQRLLEMTALGL